MSRFERVRRQRNHSHGKVYGMDVALPVRGNELPMAPPDGTRVPGDQVFPA